MMNVVQIRCTGLFAIFYAGRRGTPSPPMEWYDAIATAFTLRQKELFQHVSGPAPAAGQNAAATSPAVIPRRTDASSAGNASAANSGVAGARALFSVGVVARANPPTSHWVSSSRRPISLRLSHGLCAARRRFRHQRRTTPPNRPPPPALTCGVEHDD